MQKWEYLTLYRYGSGWYLDNEIIDKKAEYNIVNGDPIHVYLNRLGDQGWELVNFIEGTKFIFKRPKA